MRAKTNVAKFLEYFVKVISYSKSPDYVLQSYIHVICSYIKSLYFFGHPFWSHWGVIFAKIVHKVAKSKYF